MAKLIEITGKAISGEWGTDDETGDGTPVLRTTNFTNHGAVDFVNVVTRNLGRKDLSGKFLRHGDIIIEKSGGSDTQPVGRVIFYDGPENTYLFNNFTGLLRVRDQQHWIPRYVFYALFANYRFGGTKPFENRTTGLHNLQTESYVAKTEIRETNVDSQIAICSMLDRVKAVIESRQRQLRTLDTLIKARFVEMFGTENQTDEWPNCTVADVAEVTVGVVIQPTQYYRETGIPAFRSLNVREMHVNDNDWVYFSEEGHARNQKSVIKENDVLVVRSGAPGVACVATKKYAGYNAVDIIIAHPEMTKINPVFLAMFTNLPHGMNQIRAKTGGAAQQHYNIGGYKSLRIILPPLELQDQFAAFVSQVDKSKAVVQSALDNTQLLFDTLMQKYFG